MMKIYKQIDKLNDELYKEDVDLDEKKIMVADKKGKVSWIDEKDWPKYEKKGYVQAEEIEEARGVEDTEHIEMQLRKVISLRGANPVVFDSGEKLKLTPKDAHALIAKIKKLKRPRDKQNMVMFLMKNAKNLKDVLTGKKVETDPQVIRQKALNITRTEDINEAFEAILNERNKKIEEVEVDEGTKNDLIVMSKGSKGREVEKSVLPDAKRIK